MQSNNQHVITVILLSGGVGTRMNSQTPKQYLNLGGKEIAKHSFECFQKMKEIAEIVIVCEDEFRHLFENKTQSSSRITFAHPGKRRQDSVFNGFCAIKSNPSYVCVHDAARPFISEDLVKKVIDAAEKYQAATAAMPVKFTVKEASYDKFVTNTPERSKVWEIQTPQVLCYEVLKKGFEAAKEVSVTDDMSLAELIGISPKLVEGNYKNIKITTPEDFYIAKALLEYEKQQ